LQVIIIGWRKTGELDLETVEMAVCDAMHRAGASRWEACSSSATAVASGK